MRNNLEFAGKVALITGGNSGIGAATEGRVAGYSKAQKEQLMFET